jgi:hypothetical protein
MIASISARKRSRFVCLPLFCHALVDTHRSDHLNTEEPREQKHTCRGLKTCSKLASIRQRCFGWRWRTRRTSLKRLFDQAVDELQMEPLSGQSALILHAQQVALELLAGSIAPRHASALLAQIFTPDVAPPGFGRWQQVDEANWCDYCRESFARPDRTLDQAIVEEAEKILSMDWRAA